MWDRQPSAGQKNSSQEKHFQEEQLAQQILAGDQDAFASFVQHYQTPLFNYIYRVVADNEIAADILQDVFLRFYTFLPQLNLEKPLRPWLFQVAHNFCIDQLRSQYRHKTYAFSTLGTYEEQKTAESILSIEDSHANVEEIGEQHDLQALLQRAIMTLPVRSREVVILRYTSNMTFSQIGEVLHIPEPTAKTYFCRARKALKQILIEEDLMKKS